MRDLTPLVQPLSLDEAFMDLSGPERLHGMAPAEVLAQLPTRVEAEIGITVSIGLAANKFLAKIASTSTSRAASRCWARPRPQPSWPTSRCR